MRFFHLADLHLGRRFRQNHSPEVGERRREELWKAFEEIIENCRKESVDALLLSGDIYERDYFTYRDFHRLTDLIYRASPTKVFYVAGNHDFLTPDSYLLQMDLPENFIIFPKETTEFYDWDEHRVRILGTSWNSADRNQPFQPKTALLHKDYANILLLHGTLDGTENLPVREEELNIYNYAALGHVHKPYKGETAVYPGSVVPMSFKDTGDHGFVEGILKDGIVAVKFRPLYYRKFYSGEFELTGEESFSQIRERILEWFKNPGDCYRITLTGYSPEKWNPEDLESSLKSYGDLVEVRDHTESSWDPDRSTSGDDRDFISFFTEFIQDGDESEEIKRMAIDYGLKALRGDL